MTVPKRRYSMTARAAKAQATRDRIRESAMAIYAERPIDEFTLENVARQAQTTVQTVLRAFGSKEDLMLSALTAHVRSRVPAKPERPGDAAAAVRAIFDIYETVGDLVIARLNDERRIPALKPKLDEGRTEHAQWVARAFEPFVRNRPDVFEMLNALTDVYVWKLLRRDRGLGRHEAESIVTAMIASILKETTDGETAVAQLVGRRKPAT